MERIPGVLVVDDDLTVRRTLGMNLRARGYTPLYAATGEQALALAAEHRPDAVLLDLCLPSLGGLGVLRSLRVWSEAPVLVVSGDDAPATKVEALDAGADDYVTKPFSMGELFARLRSVMRRRAAPHPPPPPLVTADFTIDFRAERVTRQGRPVPLTPRQWRIVEVLAAEPGALVARDRLLREVWGPGYGTEHHYLRVFMSHIRRRLEPDPRRPRYFVTETGAGFRFLPGEPPGRDRR
ncbi:MULTISPECIES: response regulator [Nocardiopsidaceae]|uniref:response regulator n=1 Tax=Streptomonospora nanhaiensis TaxID=1323731 RepID=UPI0023EF4A31|nr:response regulator [Streptomonospora nanhaiensis]